MGIVFNNGQRDIINKAKDWYLNSSEQIFQFAGNPGTGKSLVLNQIISELGLGINDVAAMSYTGAAAIVMRKKGLINARTVHSWLYEPIITPVTDEHGNIKYDTYFNRPITKISFRPKDLQGIRLMAIDEAGTVPLSMRNEILSRGIKILVCGDLDQLDPVADKPAFLFSGEVHVLTEIMRQHEGSAIVYLSQRAKLGLPIASGWYNNVWVTTEDQLTPEIVLNSDVLLCGRNATRDRFNKIIREDMLHIHSSIPIYREKVICRQNNWQLEIGGINLANGLAGRVINEPGVDGFDGKTFRLDFMPDMIDDPFINLRCDYEYFVAPYEQKKIIKNSKYAVGEKFEFGYALTVHLAQGSQYNNGIYIEEYLNRDINNKVNYTAITRFANRCIYVKPSPKYYFK